MAVFVLGAGATRGASFVDATKDPCLPPLDADFFTQLQRVRNAKHQEFIDQVIKDVVDLFGVNFSLTLETVFTTLEHTLRMIETSGETRDFKQEDLREKRARLVSAIAVVIEESLTEGQGSRTPRQCEYHQKLVEDFLHKRDEIISFNYDCLIDYTLRDHGSHKWDPHYGYGFSLGARGANVKEDEYWKPQEPAAKDDTIKLYKLHGSMHFQVEGKKVRLKQRPYTKQRGNVICTIIPPESHKDYDKGVFKNLWKQAGQAIHKANHLVLVGYSLPPSDLHSTALFRISVRKLGLRSLVIVNPDREARRRTRTILQRGLSPKTRVLVFDELKEFAAAGRDVWDK